MFSKPNDFINNGNKFIRQYMSNMLGKIGILKLIYSLTHIG